MKAKSPVEHGTRLGACTTLHDQLIDIDPDRESVHIKAG
jgi:hypothetical protein